jgi:hypothetical protein
LKENALDEDYWFWTCVVAKEWSHSVQYNSSNDVGNVVDSFIFKQETLFHSKKTRKG